MFRDFIRSISPHQPVLIAGPTASGKSALALDIAESQGGVIVNADASQVYDCWRVITARPSVAEEARAPHALYGHVPFDAEYSTGHWLREVTDILDSAARPIIVGGTGLYFSALTEGLNDIPATPADVRETADQMSLPAMLDMLDQDTKARIDTNNRARVQRAWEVLTATGTGLAVWQDQPVTPVLPDASAQRVVFDAPKDWLTPRINMRFDQMIAEGALDEVAAMAGNYDPTLPACRAIGVPELMAVHQGALDLATARDRATIATRQYAKRQRTWMRKRCAAWRWLSASDGATG